MPSTSELRATVAQQFPEIVERLSELIKIPSLSTSSADPAPLAHSAEVVRDMFLDLGCEAQILSVPGPDGWQGRPAVVATKIVSESAPTVLLYAHHDVQPGGEAESWNTSGPFEPEVIGDRLYGRGASDDGAGIMVHYGALKALAEDLPVNIKIFIEGEEESGSPSFKNFVKTYQAELAADVIIVCDSENWKVGTPAITASLRGVVTQTVTLKVLDHAVHSGMYGGPIVDAATCAARLVATLHDDNGAVAVAGLDQAYETELDYPEDELRETAGVVPSYQLTGKGSLASRLWQQPAISLIGMDITNVANSSNTIIPSATFVLSMRVAPTQTPESAREALLTHLTENVPFGAEIEFGEYDLGPGFNAKFDTKSMENLSWALAAAWETDPVVIGMGGSIPFISDFAEVFPQADVLVTGVEDPMTNAHSENESQSLPDLQNAILAETLLLQRLAEK
ncbi:dipeptidase [Boudabousia tangfeifanii]|uniref:Dipeptidase n=1 Tax=Boudabousia tangfeifanii TaxID=1912795 RepID=A0A1D9MK87_9ACTO|nr:M20/M25/M40 family metallo-hydrolase [Boudabousia tangfeifanii]AOZ72696.1 dipeptidase [Boudabousia tangfeifanii]